MMDPGDKAGDQLTRGQSKEKGANQREIRDSREWSTFCFLPAIIWQSHEQFLL